jgi:hypothetical protein
VATPLLAEHLWEWVKGQAWASRLTASTQTNAAKPSIPHLAMNSLIVVIMLIFCGVAAQRAAAKQPVVEEQHFPKAAVDYMRAHRLPQPLFNEYAWGGYLIWRLYPDYHVFIDGRADVFGEKLVEQFIEVHDAKPRWRELLQEFGTQTVLVERDSALASLLANDSQWQKVFEDKQSVILVRKQHQLQPID